MEGETKVNYEGHPIKAVMDLSCISHRVLEKRMVDLSLSSIQSRMLGYLYFQSQQGKKVFQKELEEEFKIRKSSVSSVLGILEKKDLIRRESTRKDARQKELLLTEHGIEVQERVLERLNALEKSANDSMTLEEQKQFYSCIYKIMTKLKEVEYD